MNKIKLCATGALVAVALSSCHIYKKYELPVNESAIAADFGKAVEAQADTTSLPYLGWEQVFRDPKLQSLIRLALANNKDLKNAKLNVDIAHAQLKGAKLSYFPSLAFTPNGGSASYGGSHMNWSYTLPLAAQWEIDVFAKILNRKRGAQANYEMSQDYEQAVRSQIVCGVANVYYSLVMLNQQLDLTKRTSEIWKEQVESMELLKEAGRTNEAAVVQSRANYYNIMSSIPTLETSLTTLHNTLSLLLNTYPQTWDVTSELDFTIPDNLVNGIPVSYLAVRPDVRAAERSLAAAYYSTNSARAAFYPSLVISAQGGFTNLLGSMIKNPGEWFIQLAGQLTAPIFSRGQNIATLEAAKAQQKQALNTFEYAVLSASADVSDALVTYNKNVDKNKYLQLQVDELEKSVEYTNELFMYNQSTTYLEVLTARSSLLNAQLACIANWHDRAAALISLYQAVGGGR
ncbi:MAG: TolC family protein [Muribaculaceae bacterium]|jgi:NodT family efflux transporter outer membrane factor (OMF) lipoprotein